MEVEDGNVYIGKMTTDVSGDSGLDVNYSQSICTMTLMTRSTLKIQPT